MSADFNLFRIGLLQGDYEQLQCPDCGRELRIYVHRDGNVIGACWVCQFVKVVGKVQKGCER